MVDITGSEKPPNSIKVYIVKKLGNGKSTYSIDGLIKYDKSAVEGLKAISDLVPPKHPLAIIAQGTDEENNSNNKPENVKISDPHDRLLKSYISRLKGLDICNTYIDAKLNETNDPEEQKMLNSCKDRIKDKYKGIIEEMNDSNLSQKNIDSVIEIQKQQMLSLMEHKNREKESRSR